VGAEKQLGDQLRAFLQMNRLLADHADDVEAYSTPRRLVAFVPKVLSRQPDRIERITGPPVKVAFDAEGNYTRAAEAFAAKHGVSPSELKRVTTPKGEYLALESHQPGEPALEKLPDALAPLLLNLRFPKSMYWLETGASGNVPPSNRLTFVRPIRWIVALLGEGKGAKVIRFDFAGIASGNKTRGHRLAAKNVIPVSGFADFQQKLRAVRVEIDPARRRETIRQELKALLEPSGLRAVTDPWLEDWVVNSTEWPHAIVGDFDPKFLQLPREILITVMRDHQKYFAVEDSSGQLQPRFVAFLNREDDPKGLIRQGHERVLRARFTDAQFFWDADQKIPLRERLPLLENVTYHEKLGSYADKVRRMEAIAREICGELERQGKMTQRETDYALRAVELSKCDLTTQMVKEFTELQGVVGGLYARAQGEPPEVADAIYDHYLPQGAEDLCPRTTIGAIVSLADKIHAVAAGFSAGLEPTGSSDPFGLRRAGNGIVRLMHQSLPAISLRWLYDAVGGEAFTLSPADQIVLNRIQGFLDERIEFYLREAVRLRFDTVRAVLSRDVTAGSNSPVLAMIECAKTLEAARDTDDFLALAAAAKRTRNILSKSAQAEDLAGEEAVNEARLVEEPERELYSAYLRLADKLQEYEKRQNYERALGAMAMIRPQVDRFFDKVLVMTEDRDLRRNRLRLLGALNKEVFSRFADLSQIESNASTSVGAPTSGNSERTNAAGINQGGGQPSVQGTAKSSQS
jgi:glycyl-tRNA synthetase beta chain